MANVVFENVWEPGDDMLFESQLKELADYIIANKLWDRYSVRFFSPHLGFPISDKMLKSNYCGSGNMLAVNCNGEFFPCVRFMKSALSNNPARNIGNAEIGFDYNRIRAFNFLTYVDQSDDECLKCNVASGCSWCTGLNYDESKEMTIFERKKHHCLMHKANVRANAYFWQRYEQATGTISPHRIARYKNESSNNRYIYILGDNTFNYCYGNRPNEEKEGISDKLYQEALAFCERFNAIPVHLGFKEKKAYGYYIGGLDSTYERDELDIDVINQGEYKAFSPSSIANTIIYRALNSSFASILEEFEKIIINARIAKTNILFVNYALWSREDIKNYISFLNNLVLLLLNEWQHGHFIQIDIITNPLFQDERRDCNSGTNAFLLANDGNLFRCIADYYSKGTPICSLSDGINPFRDCKGKDSIICASCNAKHCIKCSYLNKMYTCEEIVPFEAHCVKTQLELSASISLINAIKRANMILPFEINEDIVQKRCLDPLVELRGSHWTNNGLYKSLGT